MIMPRMTPKAQAMTSMVRLSAAAASAAASSDTTRDAYLDRKTRVRMRSVSASGLKMTM